MIAKKNRLKEREVKKVLQKGKPFFSYNLVFNVLPNTLDETRFAIVISGKSVDGSVLRNIYRRMFYDIVKPFIGNNVGDIVCVIKSKSQLGLDENAQKAIKKEILFLLTKTLGKNT